jgi:hypothetical protein
MKKYYSLAIVGVFLFLGFVVPGTAEAIKPDGLPRTDKVNIEIRDDLIQIYVVPGNGKEINIVKTKR